MFAIYAPTLRPTIHWQPSRSARNPGPTHQSLPSFTPVVEKRRSVHLFDLASRA
jgi:hypothetical protein